MTAGPGTPERVRPRLVQEYVAGLRFQSELQAWSARGWSDLPRPLPGDAPDHARLCLAQCLALLGVRRPRQEAGRAGPGSGEPANLGRLVSRRETHLVSDIACEQASFTGATTLRQLGPLIRRIVHAGAAAMLHIQEPAHPDSARWVLVAGGESSTHEETPGAILLLDPGRGFPWACGHNARLSAARRPAGLVCRGLGGERSSVVLGELLVLRPAGQPALLSSPAPGS